MKTIGMFVLLLGASVAVAASPPSADLRQGVELSLKGDHEASEAILRKIRSTDPSLTFFRLVNAFKLNQKEGVERLADEIIYAFTGQEYPTRYKDLAIIMRAEASTWENAPDDLDDISRDMRKISDRLKNQRGGPQTQKQQKEVLDRLGNIIKDMEDKAKAARDAEKAQADANKGQGSGADQSASPAPDSDPHGANGTGGVDPKRVREISRAWGKLPEKERAKAMQELTRSLPPKDRAVIEAYFRSLQKRSLRK